MFRAVLTLTDFLLEEERKKPNATGKFTLLLIQIENAAKIIASHVRAAGLVDILGKTGNTNTFGEEVQKLDDFANTLLVDTLLASGVVHAVASEELKEAVFASHERGEYIVFLDPIDGSPNIDTNCPIGTIFSIYHKDGGLLQQGNKQVASGYVIYGSSVMFVYTAGNGVNGFTLDPAIGSFLLSHPHMSVPAKESIYSINDAYENLYDEGTRNYLTFVRKDGKHKARYVASLVADAHRTLLKGGIFLYPQNSKQPQGKLRLMLEVNPYAFLFEQAGGVAIDSSGKSPLTITPRTTHDRASIIMGSAENVAEYVKFLQKS